MAIDPAADLGDLTTDSERDDDAVPGRIDPDGETPPDEGDTPEPPDEPDDEPTA